MNTPTIHAFSRRRAVLAGLLLATGCVAGLGMRPSVAAEAAVAVPAPTTDPVVPPGNTSAVAVIAGGCFWGVQGVFQHVKGVSGAVSGYAGGSESTARYDEVGLGNTGHAEAVRISYDPRQISYARLLQIFFSVVHDPTQLNRQGPDTGTQYRSTVFAQNLEQARIAQAYIAQLTQARTFGRAPIVTTIELQKRFFPAESEHQDFLTRHPDHPYIVINDLPKVAALKRMFPHSYRVQPALVGAS